MGVFSNSKEVCWWSTTNETQRIEIAGPGTTGTLAVLRSLGQIIEDINLDRPMIQKRTLSPMGQPGNLSISQWQSSQIAYVCACLSARLTAYYHDIVRRKTIASPNMYVR